MSKKSFKDQVGDSLDSSAPGFSATGEILSAAEKGDADLAKIRGLEEACREAEDEYMDAKQAAKGAKEYFDGKVFELRNYIRSLKGEEMPLYQPGANGEAEEKEETE